MFPRCCLKVVIKIYSLAKKKKYTERYCRFRSKYRRMYATNISACPVVYFLYIQISRSEIFVYVKVLLKLEYSILRADIPEILHKFHGRYIQKCRLQPYFTKYSLWATDSTRLSKAGLELPHILFSSEQQGERSYPPSRGCYSKQKRHIGAVLMSASSDKGLGITPSRTL